MRQGSDMATPYSDVDLNSYIPSLRSYIARRLRDLSLVDDMVQEVMVRLHTRQGQDAIENVEGYLFRVAASVLADAARRNIVRHRSAHEELSESVHPVEEISPERVLMAKQQVALIAEILEELPERTRHAFVLKRFEDLSYAEIAERLGISVSAVEKHVAKAMHRILLRTRR